MGEQRTRVFSQRVSRFICLLFKIFVSPFYLTLCLYMCVCMVNTKESVTKPWNHISFAYVSALHPPYLFLNILSRKKMNFSLWISCPLALVSCIISPIFPSSLHPWFMFSRVTGWPIEWNRHGSVPFPSLNLEMSCKFRLCPLVPLLPPCEDLPRPAFMSKRRMRATYSKTSLVMPILDQSSKSTDVSRATQGSLAKRSRSTANLYGLG